MRQKFFAIEATESMVLCYSSPGKLPPQDCVLAHAVNALWDPRGGGPCLVGSEWQTETPGSGPLRCAALRSGPLRFQVPGDRVIIFFFTLKNVKLIKETNTFNETYVGHLEGEDL